MKDDRRVTDEDLEALRMERSVNPVESDSGLAQRIFMENAPHAANRIIDLSRHAASDRTRLDANKYIVDRVLGRLTDKGFNAADKDDPFTQLYDVVAREASEQETAAIDRAKGKLDPGGKK